MKKYFLFILGVGIIFSGIFWAKAYDERGLYDYDSEINSSASNTDNLPLAYGTNAPIKAVQFNALLNTVRAASEYCQRSGNGGPSQIFGGYETDGDVKCLKTSLLENSDTCTDGQILKKKVDGTWMCVNYVPTGCDAGQILVLNVAKDGYTCASYLPTTCTDGNVPRYNGSTWECGNGLPSGCTEGQTIKWDATMTKWDCVSVVDILPKNCAHGQVLKWNTALLTWECANDSSGESVAVYWQTVDGETSLISAISNTNIAIQIGTYTGTGEYQGIIQYTGSGNFMGRDNGASWEKLENEGICPTGRVMVGFTSKGEPLCKVCASCGSSDDDEDGDDTVGRCLTTTDPVTTGNPSGWVDGVLISWSNYSWITPAPEFVKSSGDPDVKDSVFSLGSRDTRDCQFECDNTNGYYWDGDSCEFVGSGSCLSPYTDSNCLGSCILPANSSWIAFAGLSGKYPQLTPALSPTPTAEYRGVDSTLSAWYCQYQCSSGYTWDGDSCETTPINACPGNETVTDVDGHIYPTILIGTQCWTRENLRTNNGTIGISTCYEGGSTCYSPVNPTNKNGRLYNWKAAMQGKTIAGATGICPTGWHLPTDAEWYTLENYLKTAATCDATREGWDCLISGSRLKTDGDSDFESLMSGVGDATPSYSGQNENIFYWTSTQSPMLLIPPSTVVYRGLRLDQTGVLRGFQDSNYFFSVRCVLGNGTDKKTDGETQTNNPSSLGCSPTTKPGGVSTQSPTSVPKPCTFYNSDPGPGNWSLSGEHPDSCCQFCCRQDADAFDVTDADGQAKKAAQDYAQKMKDILEPLLKTRLGYLFQFYGDEWLGQNKDGNNDANKDGVPDKTWSDDFDTLWDTAWDALLSDNTKLAFFRPLDSGCDTCPPDSLDDLAKCAEGLSWDWTQMCCASSSGDCGAKGEGEDLLKTIFGDGSKGFFDGVIGTSIPAEMQEVFNDNSDYFPEDYYETLGGALSEDLDGVPNDNPNFVTTGNWWTDYVTKFQTPGNRLHRSDVPQGVDWKGWEGSVSDALCGGFEGDKKYSSNGTEGTCANCKAPLPSTTESTTITANSPTSVDMDWQSEDPTKPCYVGCKGRYLFNGEELFEDASAKIPALEGSTVAPLYTSAGVAVSANSLEALYWDATNRKCDKASCSTSLPASPPYDLFNNVTTSDFNGDGDMIDEGEILKTANKGWTFSAVSCNGIFCCYTCATGYTYNATTKKCVISCPLPTYPVPIAYDAQLIQDTSDVALKNNTIPPSWVEVTASTNTSAKGSCRWMCPSGTYKQAYAGTPNYYRCDACPSTGWETISGCTGAGGSVITP